MLVTKDALLPSTIPLCPFAALTSTWLDQLRRERVSHLELPHPVRGQQ